MLREKALHFNTHILCHDNTKVDDMQYVFQSIVNLFLPKNSKNSRAP
jgi:hypothetical protein